MEFLAHIVERLRGGVERSVSLLFAKYRKLARALEMTPSCLLARIP